MKALKKKENPDIVLADITSQASIDLTEENLNDIQSAISFTATNYDKTGAKEFVKALKKLDKRIWVFVRKMK